MSIDRSKEDDYGPYAELYARVSEPLYFAAPAAELVAMLDVSSTSHFLDIGCGTGALSAHASRLVCNEGLIIASDLSHRMVAQCKARVPDVRPVCAELPDLPYPSRTFDVAAAAFVLSHLAHPDAGLAEMARVVKRGGRLGISSWVDTANDSAPGRIWQQHLNSQFGSEESPSVPNHQLPSESLLSDPAQLRLLLEAEGLEVQIVTTYPFAISASTREFVISRSLSIAARRLHSRLPKPTWRAFLQSATSLLTKHFGTRVDFVLRACLARAIVVGAV